jgi:hypothetical protein
MQMRALREYAANRGWTVAMQVKEVGSGEVVLEQRQQLIEAARRREIHVVLVWRLDRWGRSLLDLLATLQELTDLNVGVVSIREALDLTTSTGRAMAGMLSVFAAFEHDILRERLWFNPKTPFTITGVVKVVKQYGLDNEGKIAVYFPHNQMVNQEMYLVVRTSSDAAALARTVVESIQSVDRNVAEIQTMGERLYKSLARQRFATSMLFAFAAFALLLATVGVYQRALDDKFWPDRWPDMVIRAGIQEESPTRQQINSFPS